MLLENRYHVCALFIAVVALGLVTLLFFFQFPRSRWIDNVVLSISLSLYAVAEVKVFAVSQHNISIVRLTFDFIKGFTNILKMSSSLQVSPSRKSCNHSLSR
ncbi:hypothetical protein AXF42_Ash021303 [Apostasia shenzhenica]|uniref:Uncharacterized protein n=1 Tax=Apostasia shenzhenica TaxID=1088818 RepID=A0A2I0A3B7_9ASPA|nr:hypothetical protein AXF42_Ash021303 [Apostasia shenzhenica]